MLKKLKLITIFLISCSFLITYALPKYNPRSRKGCRYPNVEDIGNRDINGRIYLLFPNFISYKREIQIGAMYAAQIEQSVKLITDPVVTDYIQKLVEKLGRNSDVKVPLHTKVIDSDEVNAFALPGGFVFVNKGLIEAADSEDELAGVLCHELGHVAARHATERLTKMQLLQWAAIPSIFIGGVSGIAIRNGLGLALNLKILGITRGSEKEADILGAQYLWHAGYDPNGFIRFFEKMLAREKHQPGKFASWFRTHPPTPDRIAYVKKEIENCLPPRPKYMVTTSRFDEIKARLLEYDNVLLAQTSKKPLGGRKRGRKRPTLKRRTDTSDEDLGTGTSKKPKPTLKKKKDDGN